MMHSKNRYKVLPLSFPFTLEKEFWEDCVNTHMWLTPYFHRNGYYYDRKAGITWLEINGESFLYETPVEFMYQLAVSEGNNYISEKVMRAIQFLIQEGYASKAQRDMYYLQRQRLESREVFRNARIAVQQFYASFPEIIEDKFL